MLLKFKKSFNDVKVLVKSKINEASRICELQERPLGYSHTANKYIYEETDKNITSVNLYKFLKFKSFTEHSCTFKIPVSCENYCAEIQPQFYTFLLLKMT